mmetsp:Transcript_39313/g.83914  ORF Transcript_39313/g.83914 Transcript_39313/m.83914 type:complete len:836 (+) Transcript_39313:107-2614(+)|eukprot:CAMPEP_0172529158 /NCGR_PEP_ID=MMETSP1067-20121228/3309_1 /TAXON_ID=265564 ORGANISM="Thalassiosira punctigera, Strain Tpunct2005C2" /NCGR_SAMPLE_ID=MMETSP1067 /ASSEMBLY_ACC=CAM_ASM_000444 /LENGTH=835 /DNA_ID=CAMNT_0013313161 /DNA_START=103 /DNA_END=2610 /DNA_ORIENTATION=+
MPKKEKRSKGANAGAARNQNAAKQAAARRRSQKSSSPNHISWLRKNALTVALASFIFLTVLLVFVAKTYLDDGESDVSHLIPPIDGVAMEVDPERGNKTQYFLNKFVCEYEPTDALAENDKGEKGYCHPRLSAVPSHRTQRVSILHEPVADSPTPTSISQKLQKWWEETLRYLKAEESKLDRGIPKGELVMRLPRPLQVWDLDALRDKFIQQEFLGRGSSLVDDSEADEMVESSSKVTARHKHTQNPLDSGAFLAVYLIRLVRGSRAKTKKTSSGDVNDGQCQAGGLECLLQQHWDSYEQHKERISALAAYLDVLPTVTNRIMKQTDSKINPHSHPLFWSSSLLQSLFPPNTYTYDLIRHYQQMVESEYEALKSVSDEFEKNANYLTYLNMRTNVLSRAFGVPASDNDDGVFWGTDEESEGLSLMEEMRSYETSNFGSFLDEGEAVKEFKLRSMCPLLDMYNSHPNPNVSWKYDSKTSSFVIRANQTSDIPPGHSIVVSYGKYTDGHMFAKYGYVNGDGSSPTEISLAVFHRILGNVGLGRQYSQLPFQVWDPNSRDEIFSSLLDEEIDEDNSLGMEFDTWKSLSSAKEALKTQAKELVRYLMFDDGYGECIDATANTYSTDEELKLLKLQHLIRLANYREAWMVRIPPQFPDARPLQTLEGPKQSNTKKTKSSVGINANRIVSICRLLSLRAEDIGGDAIDYLREGLVATESTESSAKSYFLVEKHEDALEYRAMMCVVRLCNVGLSRYVGYDNAEPEEVGSKPWNAWYILTGEVRALGMLLQTAASEANKFKRKYLSSKTPKSATDAALKVREEGACPLNYTLPLLNRTSAGY